VVSDFAPAVGPIGLQMGCDQRDAEAAALSPHAEAAALSPHAEARLIVVDKPIWLDSDQVKRVLVQVLSGTIVINFGYYPYT